MPDCGISRLNFKQFLSLSLSCVTVIIVLRVVPFLISTTTNIIIIIIHLNGNTNENSSIGNGKAHGDERRKLKKGTKSKNQLPNIKKYFYGKKFSFLNIKSVKIINITEFYLFSSSVMSVRVILILR